MKKYRNAFWMCQSMFCAIPCPSKIWDEEARPKMLLFLPIIGLEIGLLWAGLGWLCQWLGLPQLVIGLVLCAFPFLVSGFIHLDGFMDVTDAVGSCRDIEKRRSILKDSHVGSFAVIGCLLLMIAQFAFCASSTGEFLTLIFIPVVSRCCSALAVTLIRPMFTSQYAGAFQRGISKVEPVVLSVMLIAAVTVAFPLCGKAGFALVGGLAGYALALIKGFKSLGGMNGDIAGYALTLSELTSVAVWALL